MHVECLILVVRGATRGRRPRGANWVTRGTRRSKRVEEREAEEDEDEEMEKVLISFQQTSTLLTSTSLDSPTSSQPISSVPSSQSSVSKKIRQIWQIQQPSVVIDPAIPTPIVTTRSRFLTPIIDLMGNKSPASPTTSAHTPTTPIDSPSKSKSRQVLQVSQTFTQVKTCQTPKSFALDETGIAQILIKQDKQIRALYEMQKKSLEKFESIDGRVKKLIEKSIDLSPKIFNVSNNLVLIILYIIDI